MGKASAQLCVHFMGWDIYKVEKKNPAPPLATSIRFTFPAIKSNPPADKVTGALIRFFSANVRTQPLKQVCETHSTLVLTPLPLGASRVHLGCWLPCTLEQFGKSHLTTMAKLAVGRERMLERMAEDVTLMEGRTMICKRNDSETSVINFWLILYLPTYRQ